jgi:hypothetical protein
VSLYHPETKRWGERSRFERAFVVVSALFWLVVFGVLGWALWYLIPYIAVGLVS